MIINADNRVVLPKMDVGTVDAVVTDPPYEIGMGSWENDSGAFDPDTWRQVARVCKPGAYVGAFGGRRTWHRLACAIEDGGLVIRDTLMWLYTTGNVTAKNTTLKPAWEPIVLAQVPARGSLADAVDEHGTGYLQIDASRIPYLDEADLRKTQAKNPGRSDSLTSTVYGVDRPQQLVNVDGRHPSNVLIDDVIAESLGREQRFFVCPKASKRERDAGLSIEAGITRNPHNSVKPVAMMGWLMGLICPPGGTVLDPYVGSGTTGCAAAEQDRGFIGIEREEIFAQTAELRISHYESLHALR